MESEKVNFFVNCFCAFFIIFIYRVSTVNSSQTNEYELKEIETQTAEKHEVEVINL